MTMTPQEAKLLRVLLALPLSLLADTPDSTTTSGGEAVLAV